MNYFLTLLLLSLGLTLAQVSNHHPQPNAPIVKASTGGGGWSEGGKKTPKGVTRLEGTGRYTGGGGWSEGGK